MAALRHRRLQSSVPWFWSNQYDAKLQMAGLGGLDDDHLVLGDPGSGAFSVLRFAGARLVAVESVNRAIDHMAARRILASERRPTPAQARAEGFGLKTFLKAD